MANSLNGLIELHDDKQKERGFFCMKLIDYLNEEADMGTEFYEVLWHERFAQAKAGSCAYSDKCPIHARTIKKHPVQLSLKFDKQQS